MKKHLLLLSLLAFVGFTSCKPETVKEELDANVVATVSQPALVDAVAAMYETWMEETVIPSSLSVEGNTLTLPQYQYALCKLLTDISEGKKDDIKVLNYKPADHPERDSYDMESISVAKGAANSIEANATEDLVNIAQRMIAAMKAKGQVPNQTLFQRNEAIAFSTNRATVCIMRAINEYKANGQLSESVSTEYLSAAATLKGFARELVTYLDVWEKTIGTVDADGSHCTANNSAWENVHFIPIPYSGGYQDGTMYSDEYLPYHTITVDGVEYNAAQCWVIGLKGMLDLLTVEGSAKMQETRNTPVHTMGNGKNLNAPIPAVEEWAVWSPYPWYENTDSDIIINFSAENPCNVDVMVREIGWYLTRSSQLGRIGNFQQFGEDDGTIIMPPYQGTISAMRTFLICIRFYKYLLDNNITENVYDAVKNVNFDYDLYGVKMPDAELVTKNVEIASKDAKSFATINAYKAWTAKADASWLHLSPEAGEAGKVDINITADDNTGEERSANITITAGETVLSIPVVQAAYVAPAEGTLKEFAKEFVKGLDIWAATVGTVDADGGHCTSKNTAFQNVHFIPITAHAENPYGNEGNQYDPKYTVWTLNVNGKEYTSAQAWEIAIRGLLNMVTEEGEAGLPLMDDRNMPFTLKDNASLLSPIPSASATCAWGKTPWYEMDGTVTTGGKVIENVGVEFMVKVGSWHVVRSFITTKGNTPLKTIGNFQTFGSDTLILGDYKGQICPMRELLIVARMYKLLLDNNVDTNVYTFLKDKTVSAALY